MTDSAASGIATSPFMLWERAATEHPLDPNARRSRYLELMREAGHVVKVQPGDAVDLDVHDRECGHRLCGSSFRYHNCPECGRLVDTFGGNVD